MTLQSTTERDTILAEFESLWAGIDECFASLGPQDWARRHGKDWHFADVPYHLSYYDVEQIAAVVNRGANVPAAQARPMRTTAELNAWNAAQFAARPGDQPIAESLAAMRAARERVRRTLAGLADADLDRPAFLALPMCGWRTVRFALESGVTHTWAHLVEMHVRLKRQVPAVRPSATHRALAFYTGMMPLILDRAQAAQTPLTIQMEFPGPGGGTWSLYVAGGHCRVVEERAATPDLSIVQAPEVFQAVASGALNPMVAMVTGRMRVRGLRHMSTFGKLFPPRQPDVELPFAAEAPATV